MFLKNLSQLFVLLLIPLACPPTNVYEKHWKSVHRKLAYENVRLKTAFWCTHCFLQLFHQKVFLCILQIKEG